MLNIMVVVAVYVFRSWQLCLYSVYVFVGFTNKNFQAFFLLGCGAASRTNLA